MESLQRAAYGKGATAPQRIRWKAAYQSAPELALLSAPPAAYLPDHGNHNTQAILFHHLGARSSGAARKLDPRPPPARDVRHRAARARAATHRLLRGRGPGERR